MRSNYSMSFLSDPSGNSSGAILREGSPNVSTRLFPVTTVFEMKFSFSRTTPIFHLWLMAAMSSLVRTTRWDINSVSSQRQYAYFCNIIGSKYLDSGKKSGILQHGAFNNFEGVMLQTNLFPQQCWTRNSSMLRKVTSFFLNYVTTTSPENRNLLLRYCS